MHMNSHSQARIHRMSQAIMRLRKSLAHSKQMEARLRISEANFRAIFDNTCIGLAQTAENGRFLEVNRAFCEMLGYTRAELLRLTYLDITHPDDRQADGEIRVQFLSGTIASANWEKRYVRKDGSLVWTNLNVSMVKAEEHGSPYFIAAAENISTRHTLQESLGRIATNLAKAETVSLFGTWKWNIETGELTASEEAFQIFGTRPERAVTTLDAFLDKLHPEDRPTVEHALHLAVAEQKPYQIEYRIQHADGSPRLVLASGEIVRRDENGKAVAMAGLVQDITLRRQTEQALKESEHRFRELFDNAADGIFIADREGKYIDVNIGACTLLGYCRAELIGRHIADLIPHRDLDRLARTRKYLLENSENSQVTDWELRSKSGAYVPVEVSTRILPDGRWMAIVRDIRERKRIQSELERYAAEIQDLYDNAPCGYHSLDRDGTLIQINKTELNWLGYSAGEVLGKKKIADLLTSPCQMKFYEQFSKFLEQGQMRDLELEFIRKDGTAFPVLINASAIFDDQGNFLKSRASVFDMTEMVAAQKKLRLAAAVFEHTNDAIIITNANGDIVAVNEAFARITGYHPEEVIGKNPRLLKSERQDSAFYRNLWDQIEAIGTWQGEIWDKRKSGELFPAWETITAVKDDSGKITDYISVFSDITTIKQTQEKLIELAYHDPLTGLANRLLFNDRLTQAIAQAERQHHRAALLLLDLDRFKLINDTLGHGAGDKLLQTIGNRLQETIRKQDTVARLGGDEFAIIVHQVDEVDDVGLLAQKIIEMASQPCCICDQALTISTSIGISIYPDDAKDAETLSKSADVALYSAKDKGRNTYDFYTPEMTRVSTELLTIDHGLRIAVKNNEFTMLYQPQVDLSTGHIVGIEALLRWKKDGQMLQSPDKFIHVAEQTDLIDSIGDWIFEAVIKQLKEWSAADLPPLRLAVNLSARQIKRASFLENMRKTLRECQAFDGCRLDFEITETALQTVPGIAEVLKELKNLGANIAIDDFGTGYSSLNSLKHLPVDILKIDRSFIQDIPWDPDDKAIASAIIAMGHSLGLSVVAEGIESQEQLDFVMQQECDEAQGYLFFMPMPACEFEKILKSHQRMPLANNVAAMRRRGQAQAPRL